MHFIATLGLGIEEVGAGAFAEAMTATGVFPQMSAQDWQDLVTEAYTSGANAEEFAALTHFDPMEELRNASIDQLRQAREVAIGLAAFGGILLLYALLMPDTPGLAALRARINELGMAPTLMNLARQMLRPWRAGFAIVACLHPMYAELHKSLSELVAAGPPLLHQAGDEEHDHEGYMAAWLSAIHEAGQQD